MTGPRRSRTINLGPTRLTIRSRGVERPLRRASKQDPDLLIHSLPGLLAANRIGQEPMWNLCRRTLVLVLVYPFGFALNEFGGAEGDRTPDLRIANAKLSSDLSPHLAEISGHTIT